MPRPVSMHPDDTRRLRRTWTPWLRGANIASVTWEADSPLSVSNTSVSLDDTIGYITADNAALDQESKVYVTVTTDETPARTKKITILVRFVETYV